MTDDEQPPPAPPVSPGQWVLLSYRLPREPSTPRITVWRKLKRLGVAQISDGLIALPADARTREQLEWIAEEVTDFGGTATLWIAQPAALAEERKLAQAMADARSAEYEQVRAQAEQARHQPDDERQRTLRRLRAELRRINRRDYFPPPQRRTAEAAVAALHPANTTPASEEHPA
ncbi:chromate resistance protein [Streptomyces cyaneochromogenes]|uniref:Chromate resistance protein n=1 Tax=Streptomyces cyaneochromogenes TaxID=2496836 RepID=A0A3S9MJC1_9ACTN|nr:Chromate resistance protein ChrB [Streptomyces cyaneochromogenes]AZQ39264.1 chromate resistance protein [Streptomyces cyaneochromogenes]